jgi:non-canonical purine NTP pyrophosphatase (RdgB/HAM1 family)
VIKLRQGDRLVVASHNPGKVREIEALLSPFGVAAGGAAELGLPEPEETERTFAGNARLKAEAASRASRLPALSDDSGLCVSALAGAPGVYSARWAGPEKDFTVAMARVEKELNGNPDRHAMFICALALAAPEHETEIFEGRVFGSLTFPPRGMKGFGYDPIFLPEGGRFTFGEMHPDDKHAISHRAKAFEKFAKAVLA